MHTKDKLEIMWLCQGGFLFIFDNVRIVIDPYLSNSLSARGIERMQPVPVAIEDLKPDYVCFTHDHGDHFDEETVRKIVSLYPDCQFIGPTSTFNHFVDLGFESDRLFSVIDSGEKIKTSLGELYTIPAYHTDRYSVGFVIKWASGHTTYISGDTEYHEDIAASILTISNKIDTAFICINGKLGNMNANEAYTLMKEIKPTLTIPMHYGLFAENTVDPAIFVKLMGQAGLKTRILTAGELRSITYLLSIDV